MFTEAGFDSGDDESVVFPQKQVPPAGPPQRKATMNNTTARKKKNPQTQHFHQQQPSSLPMSNKSATPTGGSLPLQFHKPGDPGFCLTATSAPDSSKKATEQKMGFGTIGEIWGGRECHCLRCSMLRLIPKTQLGRTRTTRLHGQKMLVDSDPKAHVPPPPIIVMVDLDNFGFYQFQRPMSMMNSVLFSVSGEESGKCNKTARSDGNDDGELATKKKKRVENDSTIQHAAGKRSPGSSDDTRAVASAVEQNNLIFWCFYGALFQRHYKRDPREYLQELLAETQKEKVGDEKEEETQQQQTIWQHLLASDRLLMTPCGAHSQAVDQAIVQVVDACRTEFNMLVLTADKDLAKTVTAALRPASSSNNKNETESTPCKHGKGIVTPQGSKGQLQSVLGELKQQVAAIWRRHQ